MSDPLERLKEKIEAEAVKYGDLKGGTASTKQGSYAYTDFKRGSEFVLKEVGELVDALELCEKLKWSREYWYKDTNEYSYNVVGPPDIEDKIKQALAKFRGERD